MQHAELQAPAEMESGLSGFIDHWITQLTGAEFKMAVTLRRAALLNNSHKVCMSTQELAAASGISDRSALTLRRAW